MHKRQLRGTITINDACTFTVSHFDLAGPGNDVVWMASADSSASKLETSGYLLSDSRIPGNTSLSGYEATFKVKEGTSWDAIQLLSVWDPISKVSLGEAAVPAAGSSVEMQRPLTSFDNCLQLSDRLRIRWTLNDTAETVDFGLEGILSTDAYMSWSVVEPGIFGRYMPGSDATIAGFRDNEPFALDAFIDAYRECTFDEQINSLVGVCEDFTWSGGEEERENVELLYSQQLEGVSLLRVRRAYDTGDSEYDNLIVPSRPSNFIWATGGTKAAHDGLVTPAHGPKAKSHGTVHQLNFGEVLYLQLASSDGSFQYDCPAFEDIDLVSDTLDSQDDEEDGFNRKYNQQLDLDGKITLFWDVDTDRDTVSFGVRCLKAGTWASIALGTKMVGSHSYVGWMSEDGDGAVLSYSLESLEASGVLPVEGESLDNVVVHQRSNKRISFEFERPLSGDSDLGVPAINPSSVDVVWAYGKTWKTVPGENDVHDDRSSTHITLDLLTGEGKESAVNALLSAHGVLMWVSWCVLVPALIIAARYMKAFKGGLWFRIHKNSAIWASIFMFAGIVLAVINEYTNDRPRVWSPAASAHAKLGVAPLVLLLIQVVWALNKPNHPGAKPEEEKSKPVTSETEEYTDIAMVPIAKDANADRAMEEGDKKESETDFNKKMKNWESNMFRRKVWEILHRVVALLALVLSIAAVYTGLEQFVLQGWDEMISYRAIIATTVWFGLLVLGVVIKEISSCGAKGDVDPAALRTKITWTGAGLVILGVVLSLYVAGVFTSTSVLPQEVELAKAITSGHSLSFGFKASALEQDEAEKNLDIIASSLRKSLELPVSQPLDVEIQDFEAQAHRFRTLEKAVTFAVLVSELSQLQAQQTSELVNEQTGIPFAATLELQLRNDLKIPEIEAAITTLAAVIMPDGEVQEAEAIRTDEISMSPSAAPSSSPTDSPYVTESPTRTASSSPTNIADISILQDDTVAPTVTLVTSSPTTPPTDADLSNCLAFPKEHVGDGWCDQLSLFNSEACNWDGGDCCKEGGDIVDCKDPASPRFGQRSEPHSYPAKRNPRYGISDDRSVTTLEIATSYNNFYEFGFSKDISENAQANGKDFLERTNWNIEVTGLVKNPMNISVGELLENFVLEERLYRHRCVEAWSIIVPWTGIPLGGLVEMVQPYPFAQYIKFTTFKNTTVSKVQETSYPYEWPYVEAITVQEAMNELAFLSVGQYQAPLKAQSGAPIRITLPWKYGFKSIKSIVKMEFVSERPRTFWDIASDGREYGFWANVNPAVPHRRWSQASERTLVNSVYGGDRVPTELFNGYKNEVEYLYEGLAEKGELLWY